MWPFAECEKMAGSNLWILVFLGNMLRGIGETPVMPLGMSYMDDFAREENTALYIGMKNQNTPQGLPRVIITLLSSLQLHSHINYRFHNKCHWIITLKKCSYYHATKWYAVILEISLYVKNCNLSLSLTFNNLILWHVYGDKNWFHNGWCHSVLL